MINQSRRKSNPPDWVAAEINQTTGKPLTRYQLGEALHVIKDNAGLSPRDNVIIYDDGSIHNDTDDWIGNVYEI